jgi:fido (protein-threonine AMPylation protein)
MSGRKPASSAAAPMPRRIGAASPASAAPDSSSITAAATDDADSPGGWLQEAIENDLLQSIATDSEPQKLSQSKMSLKAFRAARTLSTACACADSTRHMAAAQQFAASQIERQRAGLESNTAKQSTAAMAAAVTSAHQRALCTAMSYSSLTVERLCAVHAILCADQGLPEVGKLRSVTVKAGAHSFCTANLVYPRLQHCLAAANQLAAAHDPEVAACAIMMRLLDIHPFRDGNGRMARILCNWMLMRSGVPFTICLCSNRDQRQRYIAAAQRVQEAGMQLSRRKLGCKADARSSMSHSLATVLTLLRTALASAVSLVREHTLRAWEELERARVRLFEVSQLLPFLCFIARSNMCH